MGSNPKRSRIFLLLVRGNFYFFFWHFIEVLSSFSRLICDISSLFASLHTSSITMSNADSFFDFGTKRREGIMINLKTSSLFDS